MDDRGHSKLTRFMFSILPSMLLRATAEPRGIISGLFKPKSPVPDAPQLVGSKSSYCNSLRHTRHPRLHLIPRRAPLHISGVGSPMDRGKGDATQS